MSTKPPYFSVGFTVFFRQQGLRYSSCASQQHCLEAEDPRAPCGSLCIRFPIGSTGVGSDDLPWYFYLILQRQAVQWRTNAQIWYRSARVLRFQTVLYPCDEAITKTYSIAQASCLGESAFDVEYPPLGGRGKAALVLSDPGSSCLVQFRRLFETEKIQIESIVARICSMETGAIKGARQRTRVQDRYRLQGGARPQPALPAPFQTASLLPTLPGGIQNFRLKGTYRLETR